jgi:hypothetical protein
MTHGASFRRMSSLRAFTTLVRARGFVLSRSTFALAAAFLAPRPQNLYTFGYPWPDIGRHWNCLPTDEYNKYVLRNWKMKPLQIRLMVQARCKKWVKIDDPRNWTYQHHGNEGTPFWV